MPKFAQGLPASERWSWGWDSGPPAPKHTLLITEASGVHRTVDGGTRYDFRGRINKYLVKVII